MRRVLSRHDEEFARHVRSIAVHLLAESSSAECFVLLASAHHHSEQMEVAERQAGMVPQYRSAMYTRDELETMQLLPKHTRVRVTGNQRTKSTQNGLEGVVKKSTGLGGWLCVLLSTGESINVQRNGVVVLEAPTGDEAVRTPA